METNRTEIDVAVYEKVFWKITDFLDTRKRQLVAEWKNRKRRI